MQTTAWYSDGLRWIGSLLDCAADYLDSPSIASSPLEPGPQHQQADEYLSEVRHRIQTRY